MQLFKRNKKQVPRDILGLTIGDEQLALCRVDTSAASLLSASLRKLSAGESWSSALAETVLAHGLRGAECHLVLNHDDYTLLSAETPPVPKDEMDQALLWSLRDMLEGAPQDMVVQSFPFAQGLNRSGRDMRHVVAVPKSRVIELVNGIRGAGLSLASIDIPELALRNIAARLPENTSGVGMVSQGSRHVVITLYRNGELHVTRQLAGIADLNNVGGLAPTAQTSEQLVLDLMRTLDYYDSQLQQRPPSAIYLQPLPQRTDGLTAELTEALRLPVRALKFDDILPSKGVILTAELQASCLIALGGALRKAGME